MSSLSHYLSHVYLPGALALWCALLFALCTMWGYAQVLTSGDAGDAAARTFARRSYGFFAFSIVLTALMMILLLMMRDFRVEYVYQYSGMDLPTYYQFSAFWAGQKGSFLIWLFWGALLGLLVRRTAGPNEPAIMGIYTLTLMGLLLILVRENPFLMLGKTPTDGVGLNPLLQDNWMVIHPPIMFIGYAASAIPFSFAMASLWRRKYDGWAERAFPWALVGFLVLGTAITMGGYWAYKTLGWGGYWGWDPVENASFIPWLFGTTMIHGLHMERSRGRYRRANYVFAFLTYISVLYGTFLTRSGVLADFSVHSFVDLGISGWLTLLLGGFFVLGLALLIMRWKEIPTEPNEDPFLSRGTFMVLATITILVAAVVITAGTSAPLLTKVMSNPSQVGPSFYNKVSLPIAILIALLLSLVPYLTWRGNKLPEILRKMIAPGIFAVAATIGAAVWKVHDVFHLIFILLAALALATNLQKTVGKFRVSGLRGAGGYLAHVGVGVILLGIIASSGYDESTKVTLTQDVPSKVGDLSLTFKRFIPRHGFEKERMEVEVTKAGGKPFLIYPKLFMNLRTKQVMANPDIRTTPLQDLYVSPIDFDPGRTQLQLAKGDSGRIGDMDVKFTGFDLQADGNAMAAMAAGKPVTIGAILAVTRGGVTYPLKPLYKLNPASGQVDTPQAPLPGGGAVVVSGINASNGAVQIETVGITNPMKLSVDVTRKPLIQLVWFGLYVVILGGGLATLQRLREVKIRERVAAGRQKGE
ncbi:MAG TPA: cytochrome c-type biogenesis CcmF C-terminal domain-containing protein [Thermoanaerobaculia bacterium]|nr:cytochrome c-type biogenesis CcmF C-terminal domain-containing protein [Thermoanaerobaculia bacterium]